MLRRALSRGILGSDGKVNAGIGLLGVLLMGSGLADVSRIGEGVGGATGGAGAGTGTVAVDARFIGCNLPESEGSLWQR